MLQWYRKQIGNSWNAFHALRQLRDLRFIVDPDVSPDRAYIVAEHATTGILWVLLPPGNDAFARECEANGCLEPVFGPEGYYKVASEELPVVGLVYQVQENYRPK